MRYITHLRSVTQSLRGKVPYVLLKISSVMPALPEERHSLFDHAAYAEAIRLFNAGRYFDCHETLEPLWLAATEETRMFFHALIQLAAALHHWQNSNRKGAHSVGARALKKFRRLPPSLHGINISRLLEQTELFFREFPARHEPATIRPVSPPQILIENP
jgi:hypothetical protein